MKLFKNTILLLILFLVCCVPAGRPYKWNLSFYPHYVKESDLKGDELILYDSNGIKKSILIRANRDIKKHLGLEYVPRAIVLATDDYKNTQFIEQLKVMSRGDIGVEEGGEFIVVVACRQGPIVRNLYRTTKERAKKLLGSDPFKILFYDRNGQLVKSETSVMAGPAILAVLDSIE